jgi:hypothetical protein
MSVSPFCQLLIRNKNGRKWEQDECDQLATHIALDLSSDGLEVEIYGDLGYRKISAYGSILELALVFKRDDNGFINPPSDE